MKFKVELDISNFSMEADYKRLDKGRLEILKLAIVADICNCLTNKDKNYKINIWSIEEL